MRSMLRFIERFSKNSLADFYVRLSYFVLQCSGASVLLSLFGSTTANEADLFVGQRFPVLCVRIPIALDRPDTIYSSRSRRWSPLTHFTILAVAHRAPSLNR